MRRAPLIVLMLTAGVALAQDDPAIGKLEKALPAGWSLLATDTELVIRHDRPCFVTGEHKENEPAVHVPARTPDGRLVTLELRYHLEPKWTKRQFEDAKVTNDRLAGELGAVRTKFNIAGIHQSKGRPLPMNADETARLAGYEKEAAKISARMVKVPRCSLGDSSLFDGDETYAQLRLEVDPPEAMKEAHAVVDLVKQQCGG